jgi:precorrin-6B methylase 1
MKVKELIVLLQRKNQNATVVIMSGGDDLYSDVAAELMDLPANGEVVICPKT